MARFWNDLHQGPAKSTDLESQIILKCSSAIKPKGLNRITEIGCCQYLSFCQSTNIDTSENKWNHSIMGCFHIASELMSLITVCGHFADIC